MIDLLGATLESVMGANPVFAGAPANVRTAFARYFKPWSIPEGKIFDREPDPTLRMDHLLLLGGHSAIKVRWRSCGYLATSSAYYADTLGASFFAPATTPPTEVALWSAESAAKGAAAWRLEGRYLPDIRQEVGPDACDELLTRLARGEWLAPAPSLARTLNMDRVSLGNTMAVRPIQAGEVLLDSAGASTGLFALMPGAEVRVDRTRSDGSEVSYQLGFGTLFGRRPGDHPPGDARVRVTAIADGNTLYMSRRVLLRIVLNPANTLRTELGEIVAEIRERFVGADEVVEALHRSPLFNTLDPAVLYPLVDAGVCSRWRPRFTPPAPFGDQPGVAAVLAGELLSYRVSIPTANSEFSPGGGRLHTLAHYGRLDVIGGRDMVLGLPHACHWMARLPSHTVFIPEVVLTDRLGSIPAYTDAVQSLRDVARRDGDIVQQRHALGRERSHAILVGTADGTAWTPTLGALLSAGIQSIREDFKEASCVLELVPRGSADGGTAAGRGHGWHVVQVPTGGSEAETVANLARVVREQAVLFGKQGVANMFVRVDARLPGPQAIAATFDRVVFFEPNIHAIERRPLPSGVPLVFVALLPRTNAECDGAWYPPSTVRLRFDVSRVEAAVAARPALVRDGAAVHALFPARDIIDDGLDAGFPQQMSRLARGLTDRRVGIALSGGESWGFGHYAVLGMLLYRKIPIDVIAGASVGSVIGGYFSLKGVVGLREFIENRALVMGISMASMGTSTLFMNYLDRAFGGALLEGLDRQLVPVATNLQMSCPEPILNGRVAWGCRLSGSLVPAYAATPTETATFLDGAFADNLPVEALRVEGARLIVASNVMSPSASTKAWPPLFPGKIGLALADLNLLRRLVATYQGVLTLAFSAGGASATNADRVFQFDRMGVGLFNLLDSPEIVHRALSQPDLWETMRGVELRWEQVQKPHCVNGQAVVDDG